MGIMVVSDPDRFGPYKLVVSDPKYLGSETTNLVRTLLGRFGRYVSDPKFVWDQEPGRFGP